MTAGKWTQDLIASKTRDAIGAAVTLWMTVFSKMEALRLPSQVPCFWLLTS
ncbi:hypothetical protein CASFOL_028505 [Castilleja foliolosa]|uniref:Uncharacterized protein n=1 Tax=Castilleja foliolosa TaxID=1961234 RepID=A0ABD3CC56_9LAMI